MKIKILVSLGAVAAMALNLMAQSPAGGLAVHEWGTFTSFQGSDGTLLAWKPLETSQLPGFVFDWKHPGFERRSTSPFFGFKPSYMSLQRMETPVIYFYADKKQNVDVSVEFPKGTITEWFPQAAQIGPSILASNAPAYVPKTAATPESVIHWQNIRIIPATAKGASAILLPTDGTGSHYFTARETDAATLELDESPPTTQARVHEKFLFYRGVANFTTPLRVVMKSDDAVNIANTGNEPMVHLFVLNIKGAQGNFVYVPELAPGEVKTVIINHPDETLTSDKLSEQLAGEMSSALAKTGLYPREAAAMVKTWKDSWFQEQGVRVLYVLPRAWTDRTLPMTLNPAPRELVRTMVGRAEVLPPGVEHDLAARVGDMAAGKVNSAADLRALLKTLGRFAEPALNLAIADANPRPEELSRVMALLGPPSKFE